ncbi:MAG: beta-lactamase family protein [Saprospiraceae bacterium]|nr:beta-lactamase family protein [Saprospiraceae bacterium]
MFTKLITITTILLLANIPTQAQKSTPVLDKKMKELVKTTLEKCPTESQVSIAILEGSHTHFLGMIHKEEHIEEIYNKNAVFEIGSLSKVFTSTLLADAITKKKIKLKHPINKQLPVKFNHKIKLSYLSLANHTSGLARLPDNIFLLDGFNLSNPYAHYGKAQLHDYLKTQLQLSKQSIGQYNYSNLGAGLLAHSLEKLHKKTYEELLQEKIFKPHGMKNSTTNKSSIQEQLIAGQNAKGETVSNWDFNALAGAGAILSNVEDLSHFARAQWDKKNSAIQLTQEATHTINEKMAIGLGWHIITTENGPEFLFHNGATGGYSSVCIVNLENQSAVIILSNIAPNPQTGSVLDKLAFDIWEQAQS